MSAKDKDLVAITFKTVIKNRNKLDQIAGLLDRDRSYILNEAIENYLDVHQWQIEQIERGIADAKTGRFATNQDVASALAKWDE